MVLTREEDFMGKTSTVQTLLSVKELFKRIEEMRNQLGNERYLLDQYLLYLIKGANVVLSYEAATEGFESLSELREICRDIIHGKKEQTNHAFYEEAMKYIKSHPLDFLEIQTQISLYTIALSEEYLVIASDQYQQNLKSAFNNQFDFADFKSLHHDLCNRLGQDLELEQIDQLFRNSFLMLSPMSCWLRGALDSLMIDMISQDRQSHKSIFQLL